MGMKTGAETGGAPTPVPPAQGSESRTGSDAAVTARRPGPGAGGPRAGSPSLLYSALRLPPPLPHHRPYIGGSAPLKVGRCSSLAFIQVLTSGHERTGLPHCGCAGDSQGGNLNCGPLCTHWHGLPSGCQCTGRPVTARREGLRHWHIDPQPPWSLLLDLPSRAPSGPGHPTQSHRVPTDRVIVPHTPTTPTHPRPPMVALPSVQRPLFFAGGAKTKNEGESWDQMRGERTTRTLGPRMEKAFSALRLRSIRFEMDACAT